MTIIADRSCVSENRTLQAIRRKGYSLACFPEPTQRKVKESNPRELPRHGFLDRLRTVPRYPPKLLPQDSNLERVVQSHLCCRYTKEYGKPGRYRAHIVRLWRPAS